MAKQKFIIVSNRLPITVSKKDGRLEFKRSSGGLATALSRLKPKNHNQVWIGWPGIASDDLSGKDQGKIAKELKKFGCTPVFLSRAQIKKFYDGYSNDTIWPLFHYFQTYVKHDTNYWDGYQEVNEIYKNVILKEAAKNSTIWVHDYHLMLLPKLIREQKSEATIGFFLHVPFPSYEIFRVLPNRTEILKGLLGADLIGFHIYDYARHFLSSVLRILGIENQHGTIHIGERAIKVDAFPIGIDYKRFAEAHKDEPTKKQIRSLNKIYKGKKVILSVDRLDYSKGILKRLEAFEEFLKENPNYHKKVVLSVIAVPSRTKVATYQQLRDEIEQTIGRINGKFGQIDWAPISYQFKNLSFDQVAALFSVADIALLTPLRDGMNLVAKEYVATKQDKPGVLILSEMTGAVDEMPEAIRINPNDTAAVVEAIENALKMPKKAQIQKINSMQRRLSKYTIDRWGEDFFEQLEETKNSQAKRSSKLINKETDKKIVRAYKLAKKRLIMLDYDGTIRDFVASHDAKLAEPTPSIKKLIKEISKQKNTKLCIVSGRPRGVLDSWFSDLGIDMAAEHGAWIKTGGAWSRQEISLTEHKKNIVPILEKYAERTPGAKIEQKDFAVVWHYRSVPVELAHARNASLRYELDLLLSNSDIGIYGGAKIIEIKPKRINKGVVAEDMIAIHKPDFILCIGDDYTDEDMFRVVPDNAFTIKVGLGETSARFQLVGVEDVIKLLKKLS